MPPPYGITDDGFNRPSLDEIRGIISQQIRNAFGNSVDLSDGTVEGHWVAIVSELYSKLWEIAEILYGAMDPDSATGVLLQMLALLTGTFKQAATHSTVTLTLTGDPATDVDAASRVRVFSTGDEFTTLDDATFVALTAWAGGQPYDIGDRVTNVNRAYIAIVDGTSALTVGPTTTSDDETDGTVHWRFMGDGTAADDVDAEAVETGPIIAVSGDISPTSEDTIVTPVTGWLSAINLLDADLGKNEDSDAELRLRREIDLARAGGGTAKAIRQAMLDVDGVTSCTVFQNNTDVTDADGLPPHSVEVLVQGGDDQDLWDAILANVAAGIRSVGTEEGTALDSEGVAQPAAFSRVEEILIYVDVTLTKDASTYPTDGDDQVKLAVVAYGDAQLAGKNVVATAISAQAFTVTGTIDVTDIDIGLAPAPSGAATIVITRRQLALFDTSRITVASSNEEL